MVQQTVDSKFNEYGLGSPEANLLSHDKQQPIAVKKTALRELQNENRIMVPNNIGNSPYSKDRGPIIDTIKVSGTKRPSYESPVSPSRDQSMNSNAANGHLVYVRRKSEGELGKSGMSDSTNISAECVHPKQVGEHTHNQPHINESKTSCFSAFAPLRMNPIMNSSGKPSVPLLGKSSTKSTPAESNYNPIVSASPTLDNPIGMKNLHWEERYHLLQMLLKKLDQSDQEEYIQMLRLLSSVERSRHAVELEKRSIQLSLEEAKEVNRVAILNVLGKSIKSLKEPLTHPDE